MSTTTETKTCLDLCDLRDADRVSALLCELFEPSSALTDVLIPAILLRMSSCPAPPKSYNALIDICAEVVDGWTLDQKADFVSGHPMIGEVKLQGHSAKEQGASPTPKVVLERLAHLNQVYCKVFPGLRFITFVNGRPRAAIIPEMEATIGLPVSPQPLPDDFDACHPPSLSEDVGKLRREKYGPEWVAECERAVGDVWKIGRARLAAKGMQ